MAFTWTIERVQQTGLTTKSIFVLLRDNGNGRRLELVGAPLDADPVAYATSQFSSIDEAWAAATPLSQSEMVSHDAAIQAAAIPNWATWTEAQVVDYINTNVTSLAAAKVVLVVLARMVVALRNETWPGLQQ
jgi:hypothetical protein